MRLLGEDAPMFELPSTAGETIQLSETLEDGPSVLVFFRGHWCSYCAEQLESFSNLAYDLWRHQDVDILPITSSLIPDLVEMRDRFELTVQLLSDKDLAVSSTYLPQTETHQRYGDVPIPATFVVDKNGIVRYEHVATDPADRTYGNYIRHLIRNNFQEPYPDSYY